jgi:hypothetical protein
MRLIARVLGGVLIAGLMLWPAPAQANQGSNLWGTNHRVGLGCGEVTGGYALAAQNFLYAAKGYTPMDARWGTNSSNAAKAFQRQYGLVADGCVGPATWTKMRTFVSTSCAPFYPCSVPSHTARVNGGVVLYHRTNCDWGSAIVSPQPVGGSVRRGQTYSFSAALTGVVMCA